MRCQQVLNHLKRALRPNKIGPKIKMGHGGTLDNNATGVLVVGIGDGCKLLQTYLNGEKEYVGTGQLGVATSTLDMEGEVEQEQPFAHVTLGMLQSVLPLFRGEIMQTPPMFSNLKRDGRRYRDYARNGEELQIPSRQVTIHSLEISDLKESGEFLLHVRCSSGTYVRSLVDDIGREVGTLAALRELVRTTQDPFRLTDCLEQEDWTAEKIDEAIIASRDKGLAWY